MKPNPIIGIVFGIAAIVFAILSMAARTETPPPGYAFLDYGLIAAGAIGIIGSLVAYFRKS